MSIDLSLVPIEDLRQEIYQRSSTALIVTLKHEDAGDPVVEVNFHGGSVAATGLAETAKHFCIKRTFQGSEFDTP